MPLPSRCSWRWPGYVVAHEGDLAVALVGRAVRSTRRSSLPGCKQLPRVKRTDVMGFHAVRTSWAFTPAPRDALPWGVKQGSASKQVSTVGKQVSKQVSQQVVSKCTKKWKGISTGLRLRAFVPSGSTMPMIAMHGPVTYTPSTIIPPPQSCCRSRCTSGWS